MPLFAGPFELLDAFFATHHKLIVHQLLLERTILTFA
jgi:hypothetical protein